MGGESNAKDPAKPGAVVVDVGFSDEEPGTVPVKRGPETIKPSFDVEAYAADVEMEGVRQPFPTILDEDATEEARIASVLMDSNPPQEQVRPAQASAPQIGVRYAEVDVLSHEEQLAILRARLAPMNRVPSLVRVLTELGPVIEDPKTAYVLGFVDGLLPLETIVEVAGLPEIEALRILDRALDQHVLTFSSRNVGRQEQQSRKKRTPG